MPYRACLPPALVGAVVGALAATPAAAFVEPERCPRFIAGTEARVIPAAFDVAQLLDGEVRLTFIGHASFLIESPAGVSIVTDYSDGTRPAEAPTIATMNRAHSSHFSYNPDPAIEYLLPGWSDDGEPVRYDLTVDDVWVRNVTTNIRGGFGMSGGLQRDMNSMFVFEVSGLCIAHLGHLHHTLTPAHLDALGRIDVVLVPVDGGYTLNIDDMIAVLDQINAPLVIPMHYFGQSTLAAFLGRLEEHYAIEMSPLPVVTLARETLPRMRTVMVLPGY
jgi:L-ascorbate metabolism protein UlaG (beta-lactamase superfamily)